MESGKAVVLDDIDYAILREMQTNGRLTNQELSERVGLSPSPCLRRVKRLEYEGVIKGYTTILDEERLGLPLVIFMSITLERQIDSSLKDFEENIILHPEVADCWLMTGDKDYLLRVRASGLREFEAFLTGKLTKIPGIASIQSSMSLRRIKSSN